MKAMQAYVLSTIMTLALIVGCALVDRKLDPDSWPSCSEDPDKIVKQCLNGDEDRPITSPNCEAALISGLSPVNEACLYADREVR